jgi:hypothetical protein
VLVRARQPEQLAEATLSSVKKLEIPTTLELRFRDSASDNAVSAVNRQHGHRVVAEKLGAEHTCWAIVASPRLLPRP